MEYTPTNVWPKGMSRGDYFQTVLGPYDYYAIKYGYAAIAGARTPEQERPTLLRWASAWSRSVVPFCNGRRRQLGVGARDRSAHRSVRSHQRQPLNWCDAQTRISKTILGSMPGRFSVAEPVTTYYAKPLN